MLSENLKRIRKAKGLSQEELAVRLNVVRQTISKWEKGLSVPDADLIIRIAEMFEVSVSEILGAKFDSGNDINIVAEQLSRINEQLAIKNRRSHRIWKTVAILIGAIIALNIILAIIGMVSFNNLKVNKQTTITTETEIIDKE
jgi:Predicted transcriptional regulators